jgi:cation diffusion facilitator CzcD-associated flavoprotein CzcO
MSVTQSFHAPQVADGIESVYDVVIVGAGISGINTAYRIQSELLGTRYTIFEARDSIGGTWDFFKYPGLRSDSDLFTFGFAWRPWVDSNPIAEAPSILRYLKESVAAVGIDRQIQFRTRVQNAGWSSKRQMWELTVVSGTTIRHVFTNFLVLGTGYYDYENPLESRIPGLDTFAGEVVHPQFWPSDLDYTNKHVVCVGSGATAITLVPALAQRTANVTMLQRSPSYIVSLPNPKSASWLHRCLPTSWSHMLSRLHFMIAPILFYYFCRMFPRAGRNIIRNDAAKQLPENYPIDPHFTPPYNPFDQRVCFAPDGDFYAAVRSGRATVVTDTINRVIEDGIILKSGGKIAADIIVTATGLRLKVGGGINLKVDEEPVRIGEKLTWHHAMLQDVPNTMLMLGYTMASWTLGADASAFLLCRLLKGMRKHHLTSVIPRVPCDRPPKPRPLMNLTSTYVMAAANDLPKAGDTGPWKMRKNYFTDYVKLNYGNVSRDLDLWQEDRLVTGIKL